MSQIIQAIYENGVLRPLQALNLEEGSIVEITIIKILGDNAGFIENIGKDLAELGEGELRHLEKEFEDYDKLHPRSKS